MNQYLLVTVLSLTLIANSHCGLIDGLIGTVKDTTSSITHGIGSALHSGKNFIFGSYEPDATGRAIEKPGVVGTVSLKIHDISQAVRDGFTTIVNIFDGNKNEKGIIGRLYNRVKCRIFNIKRFFFDNGDQHQLKVPAKKLNNDTAVLREKLKKILFNKNISGSDGIKQTVLSIQDAVNRLRNNITKNRHETGEGREGDDGAGLLDVRTALTSLGGDIPGNVQNGIDAAYDKVEDSFDKGKSAVTNYKQNTSDFTESQRRNVQNNVDELNNNYDKLSSGVDNYIKDAEKHVISVADNEKNLIGKGYNKIDFEKEKKDLS